MEKREEKRVEFADMNLDDRLLKVACMIYREFLTYAPTGNSEARLGTSHVSPGMFSENFKFTRLK